MERLLFFLFFMLLSLSNLEAQINSDTSKLKEFELTFDTYNHADRYVIGRNFWKLKNNQVTAFNIKINIFSLKKKLVKNTKKTLFRKTITNGDSIVNLIRKLSLDSLDNWYYNHCVMATSGQEYEVSLSENSKHQSISLHHFYHPKIANLVRLLNELFPPKYRIGYLSEKTKQDCKL